MKSYKLLIADDESLISESLSAMDEWQERNIVVVGTAANGREVLDWLEHTEIDFLITDIRMPDMDGLELLQRLYELKPLIRVVVISGYEEFTYVRTALKYKAEGYVLKPIDTDELLEIFDRILEANAADQETDEATDNVPKTYHQAVVTRAISYMQINLGEDITLKDVAEAFHLTSHYFGQVFKNVTGQTFLSYLTKIRMDKACELLRDPNLTQYEIGARIGYRDSRYFSKVFQKTFDMSPKDYRRNVMR